MITMKLLHTGIHLSTKKNVDRFFGQLLKLEPAREYTVPVELMRDIFLMEEEASVRIYSIGGQEVEVFFDMGPSVPSVNHLCLKVEDMEDFISRALELGFHVLEEEREGKPNLVFVYDDDENPYEIKG